MPGPGADLTQAKCSLCHDITHVTRTRQDRAAWEETLRTMISRGAPLTPDEVKTITEYLSKNYGPQSALDRTPVAARPL